MGYNQEMPVDAGSPTAATSTTLYARVNGNQIAYRSIGSGPPLLMLTRFRGTLDTWDPLFVDRLAESNRVITVDYPGVGYSSGEFPSDARAVAGFVKDFASTIGIPKFVVLGWSWGGIAAQLVLLQYPEMVSHAVLIGTAPPGPGQAQIQPEWLNRALKPVNDLADEEILFFEPASEASRAAARESHDRIYARPSVASKIPSDLALFQAYFRIAGEFKADEAGRREQLTRCQVPMLILCGDNDPSVPATNWYPLIGQISQAQIIVLPATGHGPQHQHPGLSVKYIAAFLQEW